MSGGEPGIRAVALSIRRKWARPSSEERIGPSMARAGRLGKSAAISASMGSKALSTGRYSVPARCHIRHPLRELSAPRWAEACSERVRGSLPAKTSCALVAHALHLQGVARFRAHDPTAEKEPPVKYGKLMEQFTPEGAD